MDCMRLSSLSVHGIGLLLVLGFNLAAFTCAAIFSAPSQAPTTVLLGIPATDLLGFLVDYFVPAVSILVAFFAPTAKFLSAEIVAIYGSIIPFAFSFIAVRLLGLDLEVMGWEVLLLILLYNIVLCAVGASIGISLSQIHSSRTRQAG